MTAFENVPFHGNCVGTGESGHAVKGIDAVLGEAFLTLAWHRIGKASPESDQLIPVDAQVSGDTAPMHPAREIDCLRSAHQHLFGIAAAQCAGSAEWPMIYHGDRAPALADASCRHLRSSAGPDDNEVIAIHVLCLAASACGTARQQPAQDR